jgi:DMSO/TMAO reductase YedYZ molybdopterin-dependent catalytic subunit
MGLKKGFALSAALLLVIIPAVAQSAEGGVWFTGLFEKETFTTLSKLREMEPRYVTVTMVGHSKGYIERCTYKGVTLKDAMLAAGYTGTRGPDDGIEDMIRVIGSDAYGCVLSWTEVFDQDTSDNIILAYEKDGKPLDEEEGPIRLVTANDSYVGRYIKNVVQIDAVTGYLLPIKGATQTGATQKTQ